MMVTRIIYAAVSPSTLHHASPALFSALNQQGHGKPFILAWEISFRSMSFYRFAVHTVPPAVPLFPWMLREIIESAVYGAVCRSAPTSCCLVNTVSLKSPSVSCRNRESSQLRHVSTHCKLEPRPNWTPPPPWTEPVCDWLQICLYVLELNEVSSADCCCSCCCCCFSLFTLTPIRKGEEDVIDPAACSAGATDGGPEGVLTRTNNLPQQL